MSWLGLSPEFWKMPFLPLGFLAAQKSPVTKRLEAKHREQEKSSPTGGKGEDAQDERSAS